MALKENENRDKKRKILIWLVILLFITNCITLILYFTKRTEEIKVEQQLVSTTDLKIELEQKVREYTAKIQEYAGQINEKDSTLLAYKTELEAKVKEIQDMISEVKITKEKYEDAREQIERLKYYIEKYQRQIDDLKKENVVLTKENKNLKQDINKNKQVMDNLQDENVKLSNKVSLGSKLVSGSITVTGIQIKESGKQKETTKGSRMDGMKMSFTIQNNVMAEIGFYDFYIRILNPKGETLYIEGTGSGRFQFQGAEALYTVKERIEFTNDDSKIYVVYWSKGSPFEKGTYKIEIYTQGLLIGQNTFEVK
jgi:peptidoglycan hydrolase CwlO-like protein